MEHFLGFADTTVAILLNSLWEDALIALVAFGIVRLAPNLSASTRYAIWWATLIAAFAVPLLSAVPFIAHMSSSSVTTPQPRVAADLQAAAFAPATATRADSWGTPATAQAPGAPVDVAASVPTIHRMNVALPGIAGSLAFAAWGIVAAAIVLRLAFALIQLEKLKRDAMPFPVEYREKMLRWLDAVKGSRDVRLCVSDATSVPIAVGLFDAMILIPKHLLELLAQDEIDQISLHELAHLRRSDDWTNGIQRLIQAVLFFNPAVQLIGQQLDLEREVACDDWVLAQTGAVRPYALCLTKMAESTSWPHRAVPAPGVFITRKAISIRIERLLRAGRNVRTSISLGAATVTAVAIVAIAFIVTTVEPSIAFTQGQTQAQSQSPEVSVAKPAVEKRGSHANTRSGGGDAKSAAAAAPAPASRPKPEPSSIELNPVHKTTVALDRGDTDTEIQRITRDAVNSSLIAAHIVPPQPPQTYTRVAMRGGATQHGSECTGCDFSGVNWSGHDLHGQSFEGSDFEHANLSNANLSGANLMGCSLENTNLRGANLRNANLSGCDFENTDVRGADLTGAKLTGAHFDGAKFGSAEARAILGSCEGCDFSRMDLSGSDLSNLHITGIDFNHADLRNVNFAGAQLQGVDLSGADLRGADVRDAKLIGCDVSQANVDGVDFSKAQLTGVDFSNQR